MAGAGRAPEADNPFSLQSRMIGGGARPALELLEARPRGPARGAPLLFVHGAFGGAWVWREIYLPWFARAGRFARAVSLRGHGRSEGRHALAATSLDDYLDDLLLAIGDCDEAPVVVGHSMGGYLAQLLLGRARMRGLALLASLPPDGLALVGPQLAATEPRMWLDALFGTVGLGGKPFAESAEMELLFSDGLPRELVARYAARATPEAPGALKELHIPRPVASALFCGVPTLVVGGGIDRLVGRDATLRTALYHGGRHEVSAGLGHFLMLDIGAETVAALLLDWLDHRGL
jgi:pimeloyl-ACP methyl ester carboxylesterase